MGWIIFQVLCRFWTLLCIFMFLPINFNVSYSLTNIWLLTTAYPFINHTWWIGISTFQFKQLFNFSSDSLNANIVFITSENIKLFHETFREFFIFFDSMVYPQIQPSLEYQRNQGDDVVFGFLWFFLKVLNDTIYKSMWIVSIKELLFNFWYLIFWKAGYECCSVQITNDSIPFIPFCNLWWPVDW